jgi:hypothetical protein
MKTRGILFVPAPAGLRPNKRRYFRLSPSAFRLAFVREKE